MTPTTSSKSRGIKGAHRTLEQKLVTQLESTRQQTKLLPHSYQYICKFCTTIAVCIFACTLTIPSYTLLYFSSACIPCQILWAFKFIQLAIHHSYELVFRQKPYATLFPGCDGTTITKENLELDGIVFEGNKVRHNV